MDGEGGETHPVHSVSVRRPERRGGAPEDMGDEADAV